MRINAGAASRLRMLPRAKHEKWVSSGVLHYVNSRANHRTRGANENKHWRSFSAMNINQSSLTQTKHPSPMPATGNTTLGGAITLLGMARKLRVEYAGAIYHVMNRESWGRGHFKG